MKYIINIALGLIAALLLGAAIFILMWVTRFFSNSATTVTVEEVEPGIHCAKMVTADGAAIDCWKVDP